MFRIRTPEEGVLVAPAEQRGYLVVKGNSLSEALDNLKLAIILLEEEK